jgi:hypothetical protein
MKVDLNNTDNNDYVRGYKDGKKAGATEWAGKGQGLVDALESMKNINASTMGAARMKAIAATALAKYKEVGVENGKTFTVDEVDAMLIEFALMYHKNPGKDIANDAAEYLSDKNKEVSNG